MHEFAIAQDIVNTIKCKVDENLTKVSKVNIDVGAYSGVVAESLDFGLKTLFAETDNSAVQVNIAEVPTIAQCECGQEYELKEIFTGCSVCNSFERKILKGMDILIRSVEISEAG